MFVEPNETTPAADGATQKHAEVNFYVEEHVYAVEPFTGAKVVYGRLKIGKWVIGPVYKDGPQRFLPPDEETYEFSDWQGPGELILNTQATHETAQRCLSYAKEIIEGNRPVVQAMEVFPVNGKPWRIETGERIPPGVTHLRPVGVDGKWTEAALHLQHLIQLAAESEVCLKGFFA